MSTQVVPKQNIMESQEETSEESTDPSSNATTTTTTSKLSITETARGSNTPAYNFMEKRQKYKIVIDDIDSTPDFIIDSSFVMMEDIFNHAVFGSRQRIPRGEQVQEIKTRKSTTEVAKVYATTISLDDIHIDHTLNTEEGFISDDADIEIAPSAYCLPKLYPAMSYPPEIFVVLKETETCFLFELPSYSYEKGTAEAAAVEGQNEFYQYITVGKGRNRKMVSQETQTKPKVIQTRHTQATRPQKKNALAFASLWDMHDTYEKLAQHKTEEAPDEMVMYQSAAPTLLRKKKKKATPRVRKGKSFEDICTTPAFLDAVLLTKRVLATLEYSEAQKKFRGLVTIDPLSRDLIYVYSMKPLWTLECNEAANRPITCISFNPKNQNVLAVGHGKFTYAENFTGLICVWCTKNPCKPERIYSFQDPLSSVAFSDKNPNWLACGFANGDVLILDIISYSVKTVAKSKRETNPSFEPIWALSWRTFNLESQYVMAACQDGRINKFINTKTHDFICTPMMRLSTVEGKLKGLQTAKECLKVDVPITRYPAALCVKWHPTIDHVYFVGTDEGCIHKCSTHYLNQHIDVFRAHAGPVYSMQFSPFMDTLLVSCGADNAVRLWIEGIDGVILTLNCFSAVYDIAFCPINSTILISASGNVLSIWDLRRKTHMPCAEYNFPGNAVLTYIKFSPSGDNVFVGDTAGRIHTFHLEDTPIPPYYQMQLLEETIKKSLCTRPHLLKQLEKLATFKQQFYK